ncbi:hypothetical protein BDF22DRAFT_776348 [Syncephalis plumigaleata]|nr:hypothetical protein BDF22DRAFT_776348 [Syncephalis plumigaleata]
MEALGDFWNLLGFEHPCEFSINIAEQREFDKMAYCSDFILTVRQPRSKTAFDNVAIVIGTEDSNDADANADADAVCQDTDVTSTSVEDDIDVLALAMTALADEEDKDESKGEQVDIVNKEELTDEEYEEEEKETERMYYLHRSILWWQSKYFRTLFNINDGFIESQTSSYTLEFDDPFDVTMLLINYMYTGAVEVPVLALGDFYALADLLQVPEIPEMVMERAKGLDLHQFVHFAECIRERGYEDLLTEEFVLARVEEWRTWDDIDFVSIGTVEQLLYEGRVNDTMALYRLARRIVRHYYPDGYDESVHQRHTELLYRMTMPLSYTSFSDGNDVDEDKQEVEHADDQPDSPSLHEQKEQRYENMSHEELEQEFARLCREELPLAEEMDNVWKLVPLAKLDAPFLMAALLDPYIPRKYTMSAITWRTTHTASVGVNIPFNYFKPLQYGISDNNDGNDDASSSMLLVPDINELWSMRECYATGQNEANTQKILFATTEKITRVPDDMPYHDLELRDPADGQTIAVHRVLLHLRCSEAMDKLSLWNNQDTSPRDIPLPLLNGSLKLMLDVIYGRDFLPFDLATLIDIRELSIFLGYHHGIRELQLYCDSLNSTLAWQLIEHIVMRDNLQPLDKYCAPFEEKCMKNIEWLYMYQTDHPALREIFHRIFRTIMNDNDTWLYHWNQVPQVRRIAKMWYPNYRRSDDAWERALIAMGLAGPLTSGHDVKTTEERELEALYSTIMSNLTYVQTLELLYDPEIPIGPVLHCLAYRNHKFPEHLSTLGAS